MIRKAAHRDEQEQTTPSASSASAAREAAADEPIDGPPPIPFPHSASPLFPGFNVALNPILLVRHPVLTISYASPVAETILTVPRRQLVEMSLRGLFAGPSELAEVIATMAARQLNARRHSVLLDRLGHEPLHAHAVVGAFDFVSVSVLLELLLNE